ncbi:MAG: PfkB family carbohydrate kinase [Christensenellales bacterium]
MAVPHELLLLDQYELPEMAKRCQVSFDFSSARDPDYLARVCPYVTYAFFSGSHMTQGGDRGADGSLPRARHEVVGVTLGSGGSIFSEEGKRYHPGIVPVEAIDTMGAGDSFIAGFLTRRIWVTAWRTRFALRTAAANTCKFHGGWLSASA